MFRLITGLAATKAITGAVDKGLDSLARRRNPKPSAWSRTAGSLPAAVVGGAAAFLLDPTAGKGRRAYIAQKATKFSNMVQNKVEQKRTHVENIAEGRATQASVKSEEVAETAKAKADSVANGNGSTHK